MLIRLIFLWFGNYFAVAKSNAIELERSARSVFIDKVVIENASDDYIRVYIESFFIITAHGTTVGNETRRIHENHEYQGGLTTIEPRSTRQVDFNLPEVNGNDLVRCTVFDLDNTVLIQNETLKKGQTYRLKKLTDNYVLLPFRGKICCISYS